MKSYSQTEVLVKDYLLADAIIPYTSVLCGIFMCKVAYDLSQLVSSVNLKSYASLTKIQRIEWNNRGMSSAHAIFITIMSLYLVFFSDFFSDQIEGPVTLRSSNISTFSLGVSAGYFLTDLAMMFWSYPCLGGLEYVLHHSLSLCAIAYAMLTGEGQLYTYMVLISETTTPGINMRWFLDTTGMKRSGAYLINGVLMFFAWLVSRVILAKAIVFHKVARILLFIYLFYHIYLHFDEVLQMHAFGYCLALAVPSALFIMNMMWFLKILKGLKKLLAKRQ
ncbi:hypothetical protein IEQ34_016680 [Dendrobium chrysotoxum]|uniref:TLC domain-containing protein n=1 Tax=Dendrobium chrysotoxum TaxID=161865 RepID=A0AAV7GE41_DENCH|nr:hypothetical protein IEQ34_016680 [Dendrobium chrysotoxum]